jgi:hypothetical protein
MLLRCESLEPPHVSVGSHGCFTVVRNGIGQQYGRKIIGALKPLEARRTGGGR